MTWIEGARLAAYAAAGFGLGGASYAALRRTSALYVGGGAWTALALHVLRLATVGAALFLCARQGAGPLLAAAAGLALVRPLAVPALARRR
ncbi:MAG TPA: ATP synthase subunit I [Caulobacteraceae bacterium]|nr:ATP synthase subunit I [Caulobacteraceae bacterium]